MRILGAILHYLAGVFLGLGGLSIFALALMCTASLVVKLDESEPELPTLWLFAGLIVLSGLWLGVQALLVRYDKLTQMEVGAAACWVTGLSLLFSGGLTAYMVLASKSPIQLVVGLLVAFLGAVAIFFYQRFKKNCPPCPLDNQPIFPG